MVLIFYVELGHSIGETEAFPIMPASNEFTKNIWHSSKILQKLNTKTACTHFHNTDSVPNELINLAICILLCVTRHIPT